MRWLGSCGGKLSVQQTIRARFGGIGVAIENECHIGRAADDLAREIDKIAHLFQFLVGQFVARE
jgi:hypothetical protein